MAVLLSRNT